MTASTFRGSVGGSCGWHKDTVVATINATDEGSGVATIDFTTTIGNQ